MATKNYRYNKDGSKNPNYVKTSSAKKTSTASISNTTRTAGAKKTSTGSSNGTKKVYSYNKSGQLKSTKPESAVDKNPQEEKKKDQLPLLKTWGNAIKDFLSGKNKEDENKEISAKKQSGNEFDAQFTEDFFENNDRARYLVENGVDGTSAQEKAEFVIIDRMLQAGVTNRAKVNGEDNRYKTNDEVYDVNNTVNQGASQIWMDGFYKQANEDDIRAVIKNWQQMIDVAPEGSDFKRRVQEDLDSLKDYAKNNFTSFALAEKNHISAELAKLDANYINQQKANDDLIAAANEVINAGPDYLLNYVENKPELRQALGYDELATKYPDPMDLEAELWNRANEIVDGGRAEDENTAAYRDYADQRTALAEKQAAAQGVYDNLLTAENYQRMLGQSWVDDATARYNPDDYQWSESYQNGAGETSQRYNLPTISQIVEDPQSVKGQYEQARGAGAGSGMAETISLVGMMTEDEKKLYKAIFVEQGEDAAEAYFEHLQPKLFERETAAHIEEKTALAEENPLWASVASVPEKFLGNLGLVADMIAGRKGQNQFTDIYQAERSKVERKIAEATPWAVVNGTNIVGASYQGFMSFMDSLFTRGVTGLMGGGTATGDVLLGLGAAGEEYASAYDATDGDVGKALVYGLSAGVLEAGTEHISWGKLSDAGSLDSAADILKYIVASGATEGGEEVISGLGSKMIEGLVLGSDSEVAQKYMDYTANGYNSMEAIGRIAKEIGWETTMEFFIGSLMGSGAASVNASAQGIQQNAEYRSLGKQLIDNGNAASVIQAGLKSADDKIRKLAERLAGKIKNDGLPADSETVAEVHVVAESEGIDANGQKAAPSAQEQLPAFEIKQPEGQAVPAQQPAEQASVRTEEEPIETIAEETGSTGASEETPELAWNNETAAPAAEKPAANEKESIKQVFTGSKAKLGKLYTKVMNALDVDINTKGIADMTERIQGRLKQLGEETIEPVANAIAKLVTGEKPTQDELDLLEGNTVREGVLNEVTRSILRNGGSEFLSDDTHTQMATRTALQQATTQKSVQMPDGKKAVAPAKEKVQTIVEETIAADEEGSIQTRANMLGNAEAAQTMIRMAEGVTNTRAYAAAFEDAYDFGTAGIDENVARTSALTTALSPEQFKAAYQAGVKAAASPVRAAKTGGKVSFAGDLKGKLGRLDDNQKAAIHVMRKIASVGTVNIEFFESTANAEGKYEAENGSYNPETNTIRIDINAGRNSVGSVAQYALLRTASHELTHYIKAQNTEGYKALQDFVVKQLTARSGNDFDGLVAVKMKQQPKLSYAQAVEEVVADGCEMMLKDSTAIQQLAQENKSLFRRIVRWLRNFVANVKKAFQGVEATSMEARMIKDVEGLQKLWDEALVQASRNVQQGAAEDIGITTNDGGDTAFVENPEMLYSLRSYNESDYVQERDKAAAALAKKMGVTVEAAEAYIDDVTSIAAIVAADRDRLDFEAEDEYSAMKHNSEYKYTMDFSTLCKKRLLYTGTFDAIQKQLGDTALTEDDYIQLRQMMADRGYEVACAFCYVESRRKNNGEIINKFLETYKAAQKNGTEMELGPSNRRKAFETEDGFTPKISDFNTSEGIANIMHNHRGVYDAYMYFMNARGVSKPKLIESRTDYRNEILKKFRSTSAVRAMNRRGGLRLQSFSDFEVVNMLDMMQVVMDMSRVGLMSQAYTKVPAFARVFGGTGVKINLSLVTKGVDSNDKLIFDDIEGMPHKEAFKIRDMYSDHVGTILVGKDDATIRAAMADPRIDFIIPYHASGWSIENQNALGIGSYTNFTAGQNEVDAATGKTVRNFQPSEYWDYSKTGDENAHAYLEKCREAGKIPKFPQYQNYPGYWKMLIDFKMYNNDGVGSPQRAVRPDFNLDEARQIMKDYEGGHQNLPVARDVVKDFVAQYKEKNNGVMYSTRLDEEYRDAYDDYDYDRASELVREAAIAAGYSPLKLYHGTTSFGFTKVDPSKADDGISFFASSDDRVAQTYAGTLDDNGELIPLSERFSQKSEDIRYSKRSEDSEAASIRDQIRNNRSRLNAMEAVVDTESTLPKGILRQDTLEWAMNMLAESGYSVYREGMGTIVFDRKRINDALKYLKKPAERAALAALPEVLKEGIEIGEHNDHKDRGHGSTTIGAPVIINGVRGNMGVVVKHTTGNFYKAHRIFMPDGSDFEFVENKNTAPGRAGGLANNGPHAQLTSTAFDASVAQNDAESNKKFSIRTDSLTDREILADAFENVASNDTERSFLKNYRDKIADLQQKQAQLREINRDITKRKENAERKPNGRLVYDEELIKQQNRAKVLRAQIDREDNAIIEMIKSKPLQDVLRRQKQRIEKQEAGKRREAIATIRDRRNATEMRHKIKAVLDDFNRKLKNPTEKSYIPANMVQLVIAAEELIDTRSGREGEKAQAKLAAIHGMYERYKGDATFAYVYDPVISDMLSNLASTVGNRSIYDMTSAELNSVYEALKALKKQVTEAVRLKAGDYAKTIIDAGREMIRETQAAAPLAKGKAGELINWQLTPDKFFARLAGFKKNSMWSKVAKTFADGTEKMLEIQREHYYHFRKFTESKEFDKLSDRKNLVDIGLKDENGNVVKVTRGMMLSAYMHLLNNENARGFMYGGFSIPSLKAYYNGKVKESYGTGSANTRGTSYALYELAQQMNNPDLTEDQIAALEDRHDQLIAEGIDNLEKMRKTIYKQLTQYEKNLIKAVQEWNNGKSQQYINDVTMDLYGIKKASTENYFPIHRDTAFVNTDFASISKNMNLENWGSLKTRVPSQAPILLEDIAFVMDSSLNQMSRYVGYARAQRDFNKLYNVRMPGMSGSVKKVVSVKFGTGARFMGVSGEQYLENYIGSITGSRPGESSLLTAIRRNLPRATMTLNLRVAFSQLSAIPKAAAEVGWGSMTKGLFTGGGKAIFSKAAREELAKQNVWFWQRWRGEGGQREFADAKGGSNVIDRLWNKLDDVTRGWLLNWCQNFDVMSTVTMKSMAEAWVKKNTRYAPGSAEFNAAVQAKYRNIIRNTQAMSTTTERSDLARSNREGDFIFTMYKSEAFANFNLLYDAVAKLRKYSADHKAGINGVTSADVTEARKHLAGAATSVVVGAGLINALLRLAVNAIMHSMNSYRNDEDEVEFKSVMEEIADNVIGDAVGMMVFGSDLYEFLSAKVRGETYFGISDSALSEVAEVLDQLGNMMDYIGDDEKTFEDWKKAGSKLVLNVSNLMGVPANNAKRFVSMFTNHIEDIRNEEFFSFEAGANRSNGTNYTRLLNASMNDDQVKWDRAWNELVKKEVEEKDIRKGYRDKLRDAYEDGTVDAETAMDLLVSHGGKSKDDAFWTMEEWNYTGEENYSKYADLRTALKESNASVARAEVQKLTSHGVKEQTVMDELSGMYNNGEATTILNLQLRSNNLYNNSDFKPNGAKKEDKVDKNAFDTFLTAVVNGGNVANEANKLYQKGYTTKQIMSALNGAFGGADGSKTKRYRRMEYYNPSEARILLNRILKAYEAIGLDRNEEIAWINENWKKFVPSADE